jgi:rhodanese-related sulfurtransferase
MGSRTRTPPCPNTTAAPAMPTALAQVDLVLNSVSFTLWVVLLILTLADRKKSGRLRREADEAKNELRRSNNERDELATEVRVLRTLLERSMAGETVSDQMVADRQLWRDVDGATALGLFGSEGAHVIDVRTPSETATGVIKGALLIPMDEIGARRSEVPSDGRPILVYCAAGGRSAAVCEHLSNEGLAGLHNLEGGFGAWPGETRTP